VRRLVSGLVLVGAFVGAPGCLVLSIHPAYDKASIVWEPALLGTWEDIEDNASMQIARGEWQSYRIHYVHPIETGDLTGYITTVGEARYLDLMPARGQDPGSFLVPVHAVLRIQLAGNRLELTPLSYDWFYDRLRAGTPVPGLSIVKDQKENALIVTPTSRLRTWLQGQPAAGSMFGAGAVFTRTPKS
jgi:hypothetical protein